MFNRQKKTMKAFLRIADEIKVKGLDEREEKNLLGLLSNVGIRMGVLNGCLK